MRRDLKNNIGIVQLLEPQDLVRTNTASKILDVSQFGGAIIEVQIGTITGVDGSNYLTPVLQESDTTTGSDFTTVAAVDVIGAFTVINSTAKDQTVQMVGYRGNKRYIRTNLVYTGSGISAGVIGVSGILGLPSFKPATANAALTAS